MADPLLAVRSDLYAGYHEFKDEDDNKHGSFEVFYADRKAAETLIQNVASTCGPIHGWYWWACWPGCLPDGEANGPFPTAEAAYLDAIGD